MIARTGDCDVGRLVAMLGDSLDQAQQAEVTRHLDQCESCRRQLEDLAADHSWWDDTREVLAEFVELETQVVSPPSRHGQSNEFSTQRVEAKGSDDIENSGQALTWDHLAGQPRQGLAPGQRSTPDVAGRDHWVLGLLQPSSSDEANVLGEIDSMPIHSVVGQGGMGVVLKACDTNLHRFLAIKLLSPMLASTGVARQRFFREAQAAASVVHPNIVPIYAVSGDRTLPYLVMPFIAGGNLQQHLDEEGALPLERVLSMGLQVAEGLAAAHRQGIVHRDIKPANLLLDEGGFRIMLTDFGLARALDDATLTASGMVAGTPQYMSPEQACGGTIDHRSDIYSLGAVLYALATGRPPVRGDSTLEVLRGIGEQQPPPIIELNETYPDWFQRLVDRLMAKDADRRLQSAAEVAALLRGCLAHARSPYRVPLPEELEKRPSRTGRWLFGAAIVTLGLSAALVLATFVKQPTETDAKSPSTGLVDGGSTDASGQTPPPSWTGEEIDQRLDQAERELGALLIELGYPVQAEPTTKTMTFENQEGEDHETQHP